MSLQNALHRQYITLLHHWPLDVLRPNLNFAVALSHRVSQYFGTHADASSSLPTQNTGTPNSASAEATSRQAYRFDAPQIQREINALGNLLEDRFKTLYPVNDSMLHPKGNPEYYDKLMRELDEAPDRSWVRTKLNAWKGYIRMK